MEKILNSTWAWPSLRVGWVRWVAIRTLGVFLILAIGLPASGQSAQEQNPKAEIDVLLLGYYIWAKAPYVALCKKEGINIYGPMPKDPSGADPANYPLEFFKKFDVVIASGPLEMAWDPQMIRGPIKAGVVANLLEYNRQGGGVIWIPLGAGHGAETWTESIGKRIDAKALGEQLSDPKTYTTVSLMSSFKDKMAYLWTTDIKAHSVTKGVDGLFFGLVGEWLWPGTIPMQFGPSWEVLIRGMPSTRTTVNGAGAHEREFKASGVTGTYESSPELIAIREAHGDVKGRMMVMPIYTSWTWGNYGHPALKDAFLFNGDGTHSSKGQTLIVNALRWLAEPAEAAKDFGSYQTVSKQPANPAPSGEGLDMSPVPWSEVDWSTEANDPEIRGIFGAASKDGGGRGTVAEWAAAGRVAGLNFIVFTDDVNKHTKETYKALVDECTKNSDAGFTIVPGFGGYDINGVYRFFPGAPTLPERKNFNEKGQIVQAAGIAVGYGWTVGQVFAEMGKMPYNPWWEHVVMACAPLTYEGGKLTDNGLERWLRNCEANDTKLLPISLVRLKSPGELKSALGTAHLTIFRSLKHQDIRQMMRLGAGGKPLPSYLTNGPKIPIWRNEQSPGEPYRPNSARFRILLKATSEKGLAEVAITDAATGLIYRKWNPQGQNEFVVSIDESTKDQRTLGLTVTDVEGHTAIAAPIYNFLGLNRVSLMTDRLMGLNHTGVWNKDFTEVYNRQDRPNPPFVKGHPYGGGEFTTDHIEELKIQGIEGSGIYPPAFKLLPSVSTNLGKEPTKIAMRYERRLASHDLKVFDYVGDQQYKAGENFVFNKVPRVADDTQIADIVSRIWKFRTRNRTPIVLMLNEITVTFKKDVDLKEMFFGEYVGPDAPGEFDTLAIKAGSDAIPQKWKFAAGEQFSQETAFTPGGYLFQGECLAGSMGIIALDDKIISKSSARRHAFYLNPKYLGSRKVGDKITVKMLRFARNYQPEEKYPNWLEELVRSYGIATTPLYPLQVKRGVLQTSDYILRLRPEEGGAQVEIGRYNLPEPLAVAVTGLRKNAILGEYNPIKKQARQLQYFEGGAYTTVDTNLDATDLYLGEWLSWDESEVRVSLVPDGTDFALDVHNPTNKTLTCKFEGSPGFAPLASYRKELRIPAFTTVKEKIKSNPGSIELKPIL